ncbi:hypothetical protein E3P89_02594, partial [Wallemia ichthyophaga]
TILHSLLQTTSKPLVDDCSGVTAPSSLVILSSRLNTIELIELVKLFTLVKFCSRSVHSASTSDVVDMGVSTQRSSQFGLVPVKPLDMDKIDVKIAGSIKILNNFLIEAPSLFNNELDLGPLHPHALIHRIPLESESNYIHCIRWLNDLYISSSDLFKIVGFKLVSLGRHIRDHRKLNEGISSDLRNLKPGIDSIIQDNGSELLDLLFRYGAIRTQKKQKLFNWHAVPHDRLFLDALERDLKREAAGNPASTIATFEPSFKIKWLHDCSLHQQLNDNNLSHVFLLGTKNGSEFYKQGKTLRKILQKRSLAHKDTPSKLPPWNHLEHLTNELPDERTFRCDECGKAFKRHEHLRRHRRSHTKERPFRCDVCLKSFTRSDNLAVHTRTHSRDGKDAYRSFHSSTHSGSLARTSDSDTLSDCSYMSSLTNSDSASQYSSRPSSSSQYGSPEHLGLLPFGEAIEPSSGPMRKHRSEDSFARELNYFEQQQEQQQQQQQIHNTGYSQPQTIYGSSLPTISTMSSVSPFDFGHIGHLNHFDMAYAPIQHTQSSNLEFDYTVPRTTQSLPSFDTIPASSTHSFYEDDFRTPTVASFGFTCPPTSADRMSALGLGEDYTDNGEGQFAYQPPPLVEDSVRTPGPNNYQYYNASLE